jgi:diguanylate cyclase (GGDEF)-like protein
MERQKLTPDHGAEADASNKASASWKKVAAPSNDFPAALSGAELPGDILRALQLLEQAVAAHSEWLKDWHLYVVGRLERGPDLGAQSMPSPDGFMGYFERLRPFAVDRHPAFAELDKTLTVMQQGAERIAHTVEQTQTIPADQYGQFMQEMHEFNTNLRQLQNDTWNRLANIDPLTGLGNRQAMLRKLDVEWKRQERNHQPCCVALLDLDYFKTINDSYGHSAGDTVLRSIASLLAASIRPYDEVFRYGGDEFVICLPNADARAAWAIVERLRLRVARWYIPVRDDDRVQMTISVGVAPLTGERSVETALDAADAALYVAKRNGRNCVHVRNSQN